MLHRQIPIAIAARTTRAILAIQITAYCNAKFAL
jgi:hypothetical protein